MSDGSGVGKLDTITTGERLYVNRRRGGVSRAGAAMMIGVPVYLYGQMERGTAASPFVAVGRLKAHERCFLHRRRAGRTLAAVAADMEYCRQWISRMERGLIPCDRLLEYWESQ